MKTIAGADLFCGAGGTSTGLIRACNELGIKLRLVAVNHDELAIETHQKNHPWVNHFHSELESLDPLEAVPSGRLRILVASPECIHFSNAAGGRPMNEQSRASADYILKWLRALDVEDFLLENVSEFRSWGPLHKKCTCGSGYKAKKHLGSCKYGRPVEEAKGTFFEKFKKDVRALGYTIDYRIINCADFGDPTTRKRFFMIGRKRKPIVWPEPSHMKYEDKQLEMFTKDLPFWVPAANIIDWMDIGSSIFTRKEDGKKPLVPNTLARIWRGVDLYAGGPFMLGQQSAAKPRKVDQPVPTIAGAGAISIVNPFMIPFNSEREGQAPRSRLVTRPFPTVTGQGAGAIISPLVITMDQQGSNGKQVRPAAYEPLPTITGKGMLGIANPFIMEFNGNAGIGRSVTLPFPAVTGADRLALTSPIIFEQDGHKYLFDIYFRMFKVRELARAQSFPEDYEFSGGRDVATKQIGNSVPGETAKALCLAILSN